MKILLLITFICLLNFAYSQNPYELVQINVVGGIDDWTVETNKEYLLTVTTNYIKKFKLHAGGAKLIYRNNKYYVSTTCGGEFVIWISNIRNKALGPPSKFRSINKQ